METLQRTGFLSIPEAAAMAGVTEMTIRRDMRSLGERHLVMAVKGGMIPHPAGYEPENSSLLLNPEKFALAEILYNEIMPVKRIFLSCGFTTLAFAKILARRTIPQVTVMTNSLAAAAALFRTRHKVILLGGELRQESMDLVGDMANSNLECCKVDYLISGCDAASAEFGFYTTDPELSRLERNSIAIAGKVAIVTESGKFSLRGKVCFARPHEVDLLVTDRRIKSEIVRSLNNSGVKVVLS
ncbi:MAG: DeoR/GlpR transcriptional regulator [Lentisphaeria bacterium]|nr:DeoR/GlpR transcriptional regulator [Lentisphaeria bacterium]